MNKVGPTPAALVPLWKPGDSHTVNPHPIQATLAIAPPAPTSSVESIRLGEMDDNNKTHTVYEVITKIVYQGFNASTLSTAPLSSSKDSSSSTSIPDQQQKQQQNPISTITSTQYYTSFVPSPSPLPSPSTSTAAQTAGVIIQPTATVPNTFIQQQEYSLNHTGGLHHPNPDQIKTIWVAAVMLFALLVGWNMIILRDALYPWKMWGKCKLDGLFRSNVDRSQQYEDLHDRLSYEFGECVF